MSVDPPGPKRRAKQFTLGALLAWMVLFALSLSFVRYAVMTSGVLAVVALQLVGAAIGAPVGYLFGEDRVTGAIFGGLVGGAVGMLVAFLVTMLLVMSLMK